MSEILLMKQHGPNNQDIAININNFHASHLLLLCVMREVVENGFSWDH